MPRRSVHKAPFISFEGGEGAGKTTQVELLRQRLESLNLPVLVVREPGTTRLGRASPRHHQIAEQQRSGRRRPALYGRPCTTHARCDCS